jgi:hypothetical protein
MGINWTELLKNVGGGAALLGIVAWLIKTLTKQWLDRDAEGFKSRLQATTSAEIERLRNSLQMVALEHQVRFTKLHEKRAEVIADLYGRMVNLFWESQYFVHSGGHLPQPRQHEEFTKTESSSREFALFVESHRIYLPESVCTSLDAFVKAIRKAVIDTGVYGAIENPSERITPEYKNAIFGAINAFETELPIALSALQAEFRNILEGKTPEALSRKGHTNN